jgi:uncharacterized protein YdaU (DUF1376 family)
MGNVVDNRGKNKSSAESIRPSYARFYASKWRSGTLMLTLEEEGLYIRVSAFQMECGQPIPTDWKEGARLLCVQPLKYRKTVDALIAKGKLVFTPDGIICERAMHEFKRASKGVDGDKPNPPTNPDTNPHTNPDTYPASMGVEAEKDEQKQTDFDKRREEKSRKEDSPPSPPSNVKPISDWRTAFGGDDHGVEFQNGKLVLVNGTRADWLSKFGGDAEALDLALIEAAGSIQRNSPAGLKLQVERKLASIARERRDRGQRYAKAVEANKAAKPAESSRSSKPSLPRPLPRDEAAEDAAIQARVKVLVDAACAGVRP